MKSQQQKLREQYPTRLIVDSRNASKDLWIEHLTIQQWRNAKPSETRKASNGTTIEVCGLAWDATNQAFTR